MAHSERDQQTDRRPEWTQIAAAIFGPIAAKVPESLDHLKERTPEE